MTYEGRWDAIEWKIGKSLNEEILVFNFLKYFI